MALQILIVDDEAIVREILSRQLKAWGHEVILAASAEEALTLLEKEEADAVLLDNVLPGMTGLQSVALSLAFRPDETLYCNVAQREEETNRHFCLFPRGHKYLYIAPVMSQKCLTDSYQVAVIEVILAF